MPATTSHQLSSGNATTLHLPSSMRLHVHTGRLWITRANDLQDYFVSAGETLALAAGMVVLEADGDAATHYALEQIDSRHTRLAHAPWRLRPTAPP